ncbi:hypothetical protein NKJ90_13160 [Mesorhizobium sp. M0051]|uniref:hypothetical protein n=1 Tax=unclassified Mesorhizobium TaxID=325217 RepID=UPI0012EC5043|nr:hypothetical protein [Mesorhizobium sp. LNHC252B00]
MRKQKLKARRVPSGATRFGNSLAILPLISTFHKKEILPIGQKASDFLLKGQPRR